MKEWFLKPIKDNEDIRYYQNLFSSEDSLDGDVTVCDTEGYPGMEHGQRQKSIHRVQYASGVVRDISVNCISLPAVFSKGRETLLQMIKYKARSQVFDGKISNIAHRHNKLIKIKERLTRKLEQESVSYWDIFFNKFFGVEKFKSILCDVVDMCGGKIKQSTYTIPRSVRRIPSEVVQQITFTGGSIRNNAEIQRLLAARIHKEHLKYLKSTIVKRKRNAKSQSKSIEGIKQKKTKKREVVSDQRTMRRRWKRFVMI
jgi:hypothetical protein